MIETIKAGATLWAVKRKSVMDRITTVAVTAIRRTLAGKKEKYRAGGTCEMGKRR
jgi:hypothetical protein